ncbi:MAG: hypothetical protein EBW50_01700 [Candidatus Fonsibacter ubiquis]|jgi:hypothetical protein|nr:hypothetical protein [Candidatus Fonsibacter ubiquis]NCV85576.1 hypothetical protein [Oxalobacteraceae bacterium]
MIKDVFTQPQIDFINQLILDNYDKLDNQYAERGREDIALTPSGISAFEKSNPIAKEICDRVLSYFDEGIYINAITYGEYTNKHNNPNLPPHKDPIHTKNGLTFDYLLDSNVDWPICLEGDCVSLEKNSAISFSPCEQYHHRPEMIFNDGDYVKVLFFMLRSNNDI